MKLKPFKELLKMGKEKIEQSLAPVRALQAMRQAEVKIAEIEEKIITQESKVMEIASTHPVDFDRMIKALDELALMERRKKQFEKIKNEMFPEDERTVKDSN